MRNDLKRVATVIAVTIACLFFAGRPTFAQASAPGGERLDGAPPSPHRLFLSVAGFGDIERFANDDVHHSMNGDTVGIGVGIGTFVARRWSLRFEAEIPRWIDTGVQVQTSQASAGGLTMTREERSQLWHQTATGTVLLAFHPSRRGRVRMAYAAGVAFVWFREEGFYQITYTDQTTPTPRTSGFSGQDDALTLAPVLRVEAAIRLSRRLELAPYFSATAFDLERGYFVSGLNYVSGAGPGVFIFRPGAALRCWF